MVYEIHTASKDNTKDEVRAAAATSFEGWTVEAIKDAGDEWQVRLVREADKPPFLQDKDAPADDAPDEGSPEEEATESPDEEKAEDGDKPKDDSDSKGKGDKPKGDVVSELKDLMGQLQDVIKQVSDKAGDAVAETEEHRQKLDEAQKALGDDSGLPGLDDVPSGPGGPGDETPPPPMPGGAKPPMAPGGKPKLPFGGPKSVVPGRPGTPGGGGPGLPTFTHEIATHPGVNDKGERISLLAAAQDLETDAEFAEYEVIGMIENADGSYSAKLKKKSE